MFENATGAHVIVDGQFGSTGKGVLAAFLAERAYEEGAQFSSVISNAGPNSGHTFYHNREKHVLKQLPTFAVKSALLGNPIPVYLSAGAIIDPEILKDEARRYPDVPIYVHPMAAVITEKDKEEEHSGTIAAVAGTRSGTGAALARKVLRDPSAVWGYRYRVMPPNVHTASWDYDAHDTRPMMLEVSQGFSLGIHSNFYPKVTSRECTVMQAIADARIPAQAVSKVYMSVRTYPIRVGNVDGFSSGDCYPDQYEIKWSVLGVQPELTTVTKRQRRLFTWSDRQFLDACCANQPDVVFVNFMNYLRSETEVQFFRDRIQKLRNMLAKPFNLLEGWGPSSEDVRWTVNLTSVRDS